MEYQFRAIEKKWQTIWKEKKAYQVSNDSSKPKCYVLDMFPYPSGAGLHVGHPLGYIASDIYSRFKRLKGFNVLHPMGYDAFGLPAEQYAIEHGVHPSKSTHDNINNFRKPCNLNWEVSAANAKFRNSEDFMVSSLRLYADFSEQKILENHPCKQEILSWIKHGVKIEFFSPLSQKVHVME